MYLQDLKIKTQEEKDNGNWDELELEKRKLKVNLPFIMRRQAGLGNSSFY